EVDAPEHDAGIGRRRTQGEFHLGSGVQADANRLDELFDGALFEHAPNYTANPPGHCSGPWPSLTTAWGNRQWDSMVGPMPGWLADPQFLAGAGIGGFRAGILARGRRRLSLPLARDAAGRMLVPAGVAVVSRFLPGAHLQHR